MPELLLEENEEESQNEVVCKKDDYEVTHETVKLNGLLRRRLSLPVQKVLILTRRKSFRQLQNVWSSGNFGNAGARSAPSTPAGSVAGCNPTLPPLNVNCNYEPPFSQPSTPASYTAPAINRSPSHSLFTNKDKSNLKHLSTSTPAMTAQAQLTEPPSPKLTKEAKVHTTSKARQKKFHRHFPAVGDDEKVLNYYSCALIGDILLQGHLYITKNYFAFYSNVFGYVTKLLIPMLSVEKISKEKTARIIPNAVGIATSEDKHVFGSLMSRDNTFRFMTKVWQLARDDALALLEPVEIVEPVVTDSDSSGTRDGESGHDSPPTVQARVSSRNSSVITVKLTEKGSSPSHQNGPPHPAQIQPSPGILLRRLPALPPHRQHLVLLITTLLLVLLFLSAAVLLYRISRVQSRYAHLLAPPPPAAAAGAATGDIYGEILQWQSHLHSKSAGAVHSYLDSNLDQIAKVRQSLEALSTLLMPNNSPAHEAASKKSYDSKDAS